MLTRAPEGIVNTAVVFVLLSVRSIRAFATCGTRRHQGRPLLFYKCPSFFPQAVTHRSWVETRRTSGVGTLRHVRSVGLGAQRRKKHGPLAGMPESTSAIPHPEEAPLKRHCNSFLLPLKHEPHDGRRDFNFSETAPDRADRPLALVILNTLGDDKSRNLLSRLWARAAIRICADGGANRLHDSFDGDQPDERARFVPDAIVGDLDSLRPEVSAYYEGLGTEVKVRDNQDHNDFEKCLVEIEDRVTSATAAGVDRRANSGIGDQSGSCPVTVVGLGAFGGRFDHEMAAISILHAFTPRFSRLVLIGSGNIACLLTPGFEHVLQPIEGLEGPTVGLIPVGGPCKAVTTDGLKWNLTKGRLEFGILVSSSNCVVKGTVRITTDAPLVWTAELKATDAKGIPERR